MKIIPAKTPGFVKALFPSFAWNIDTTHKVLYLTFDDGPTPEITDWVLNTLKEYNAKATFFCIGKNIESHPEIFQSIIKAGHSIGNHTYNHLKGWKTKTAQYIEDIEKTQQLIHSKHQAKSNKTVELLHWDLELKDWDLKLFRPPYGKFKSKQSKKIRKLGYNIVLWDVLSYDWDKSTNEEACLKNIISAAKEGSIIVFHDSVKASQNLKYSLPKVLDYYSKKGFIFKSLNKKDLN
ncbi:polysaccharide deacetylase family protein [Winogradskyella sp.]|jgi:peptidoglycan/xylan/chitin deacetylase (PgdA/CDA1 family)|uniref:polysaccharide deacetylase family protein n=1 Tax=Winogradskyella sp. TaxID=1883156 RepID=UPI0025CC86B3|nr:polysaccharide deacetylase family protein [Winogradskyella sp.]MCT4628983.1 polysaccharide deacetylase family protein [Winogradskyella sp.]